MESVEVFMKVFTNSWKNNNCDAVARILKDARGYLQNVSKNDAERVLEIVFDEHKGLFKFIKAVITSHNYSVPLKECFFLLQYIMTTFRDEYERYIMQTRDECFSCIKSINWFYTRKTAGETLKKLIELYKYHEMHLEEIVEYYIHSYHRLYKKKDGSILYIVLGAIAKHCPKTENMNKFAEPIFFNLLNDFKEQYKPSVVKQSEEIKIYIDCLTDMLINFVPFEESSKNIIFFEQFYNYFSKLCEPNIAPKVLRDKIIYAITTHMKYYSSFIFKDYHKWHTLLNNILDETNKYMLIEALRIFYKIMASVLLEEDHQDIFLYFKNYFILNLHKKDLSIHKLRLIIYGLGIFSSTYVKYSPIEVYEVFQMIALQTLPFYAKEYEPEIEFEAIVDYVQTLSLILCNLQNITMHQVNVILELCILFTKRFPELKVTNKIYATNALKNTFNNISKLDRNLQREFFFAYFREGILWTCSHTLLIDVELQQEIQNLPELPISYKNYLPLWHSLFYMNHQAEFSEHLTSQIFTEFISVLMWFINKLNLNLKKEENNFLSDISVSLKAENEADFRFFINLVDLNLDIFEKIESDLLLNWIEKLLIFFIKFSRKNPLISGYYKLIDLIFKKYDHFRKIDIFSDNDISFSKSTCELVPQYLSDVIQLVKGFSGEMQLSCIYLIFNSPSFFITDLIDQIIPVFKIAFNVGLTELSLAFCAIDTLENWIRSPDIQCSNNFLKNIISYIEPYFYSEETSINISQTITKKRKGITKNVTILNVDQGLEALQKRILLFYGSLDSIVLNDFIHKKSIQTNASWNRKNLLQCELLFPDIRLEIYFDKLIPRIIELTKSGDRKTKMSACELLHTIIIIILGKKLMDQCFNRNLCDTILKLGCDPDDAVKNLYHPLVIQLTHYLSSKLMKESRVPQDFLDSLFNGLSEEFNPLLRDYCGLYLKEFVQWTIKQSSESDFNNTLDTNIRIIIRRITNLALYPSNKKRLAAAVAFNHLYMILRENTNVLNIYWLEFLYAFVKSLEECDDEQIIKALNHIEHVIKVKSNLFNAKSNNRRKPPGFQDETLKSTLIWLFTNCGSMNIKCRRKCMELFENLFPLATNYESINHILISDFNEIIVKNLEEDFEYITDNKAKAFLKSLDFYSWIIQKKFLKLNSIINDPQEDNKFFKCFTKFVSIIIKQDKQSFDSLQMDTLQLEVIAKLKNEIILKILEFMSIIMGEKDYNFIHTFCSNNLYVFIAFCTLCPHKMSLTAKKFHILEKLPTELEKLLRLMIEVLSEEHLLTFREIFLHEAKENSSNFVEVHKIFNLQEDIFILKNFVEGLIILKRCKLFNFEKEYNHTLDYIKQKIQSIFNVLKCVIMGDESCKIIDEKIKDYLEMLMRFFLEDYKSELVKILIDLIMNHCPLITSHGSTITHGEYFLEIFREPVFQFILKNPIISMQIFDEFLDEFPDKIFYILEELLIFAKRNIIKSENLAEAMILRCDKFQRLVNNIEQRRQKLFNIYKIAVTLKNKPIEATKINGSQNELYSWILEELFRAKDLETKTMFLQSFLVCLTDEDSTNNNHELSILFRDLRNRNTSAWLQKLQTDDLHRFQASACFQVLLKSLIITKSLLVYETIMRYVAGVYKCLCKEDLKDYLKSYFANISDTNALKSLKLAYKIFMDLDSIEERFEVLRYFLLPSIESTKASIVETFYEQNSQEIIGYLTKKIQSINIVDRMQLIVSKIGSFNMFELLFAKLELKIVNVYDPDTKSEKRINQILVLQAVDIRGFSAENQEEKEIIRLLHCAALNCCISIISVKEEEKFYKFVFMEDTSKNHKIWENIVDCEKKYNFHEMASTIRKDRRKLINIRKSIKAEEDPLELSNSYLHRYNLVSLTFLEDVHTYDLNDATIFSQAKVNPEKEQRLDLSFENDELNNHECMPMICGVLVHMFNNEISSLPDGKQQVTVDGLPLCLKYFRNAFVTRHDNVRLFLLKIICNTKNAFLPCMKVFFAPIVKSTIFYLKENPLNYIIRDILVIIIESQLELTDEYEKNDAQSLLCYLIERAPDSQNNVYKYNLEIIESLCKIWSNHLKYPENLDVKIDSNPDLAIKVIVILFRCNMQSDLINDQKIFPFVKRSVQQANDNESSALTKFEALGWLLRHSDINACREREIPWLVALFHRIEKTSRDRCARCACAVYRTCGSEAKCKDLVKFVNPKRVADDRKPECLELFFQRIPELEPLSLPAELLLIDFKSILTERILGCEDAALKIIERLVPLLTEPDLEPYIQLVVELTGPSCILEHRKRAYKILMDVYGKYPPAHKFSTKCMRQLVVGIEDSSDEVQDFVFRFWRERLYLSETCSERFIELLGMYETELHSNFARFLCLMMLELTGKSLDDKRSMFKPLIDCTFRDYEIFVSWRRINLGSMAPLFAPSLASKLSLYSQFSQVSNKYNSFAATMRLLATQEPQFEPSGLNRIPNFQNSNSQNRKIPDPSQNKLSRRLIATSQASSFYGQERLKNYSEYHEKRKKEIERQRNGVKIHRKYRIGDFPDVEITHASFIETLRQFIMKDWLFCKNFAVALICSLIEHLKNTDKHANFTTRISKTFHKVLTDKEEINEFAPIVLEIILQSKEINVDVSGVSKICKNMRFDCLGILLLEEKSICTEMTLREEDEFPPTKRMKTNIPDRQNWIELATLYKSIGETDVVNSIFRRQDLFFQDLRDGALQEAKGNWQEAVTSYEMAYEVALDLEKDHCLEGMFECLSQLSSWGEINKKVETILNGKYNAVWEHPKKNQLLPWIFKAQLHETLDNFTSNKNHQNELFLKNFDHWLEKSELALKKCFGEELSVFYLCGSNTEDTSKFCLKSCFDHVREQWIHLSSLCENSRIKILTKLRGMHNISIYMATIKSLDIEEETKKLIEYWNQHLPSSNEDLLSWNMHVSYRLAFVHLLHEKFKSFSEDSSSSFMLNNLIEASIRQRLKISELAIKNKNNIVAKKHTLRSERILNEKNIDEFSKLKYDFNLIASKYKFLCGQVEKNLKKKFKYYITSWEFADNLLNDENVEISTKINAKYHLFDLTVNLKNVAEEHFEISNLMTCNDYVLKHLNEKNANNIYEALRNYSFNMLKDACTMGTKKEMAESYTKFGKYCYNILHNLYYYDSNIIEEFVSSILTAMSFGSLEAADYFPCLLKKEYYRGKEQIAQLFITKSNDIPSWLFLFGQTQIISNLNNNISHLVIPIIQRLIQDYPNAVIYNFRQTYEAIPAQCRVKPEIYKMYKLLFNDSKIEVFFDAMHRVCQPEHYLRYYLLKIFETEQNFSQAIDSLINKTFDSVAEEKSLQGPIYKVLDKYKNELQKLKEMNYKDAKIYAEEISKKLYNEMKERLQINKRKALQLKDYCPYLSDFSGESFEMEIPGQYNEIKKPLPQYHIKISKFDRFVRVMESKCNPIKINLIGNDAKTHGYLVKFGEDLRQDQRLQEIFKITNKILDADAKCKSRHLSVNTYNVVPLSISLGLIKWVDETKSLKEFIEFSMTDKSLIETVAIKYENWIQKAGKPGQRINNYKEAVIKYNPNDVVSKMKEFIGYFDSDLLKRTFFMLSPSLECFVSLRHNFIKSYATMCIVHWITGVGDRHLENMLIEVKTGKCYGIDFGLAFGLGIEQSIPELVPFRLTTQIFGLFQPFDEQALFGISMTHVLTALRSERGPLIAYLDVFIHEPLDWSKNKNKKILDNIEFHADFKWLPKKKIAIIEKKLNGVKPSKIMLEELSYIENYDDDENGYYSKYELIINGSDLHHVRSRMKNECLTPDEQVQCLLEQAKDLNVLGRMYSGWCPFV